jgi:hypothetical protein
VKKALRGAELESVEARLEEMERKLDRLRSMYESFFMGTERTPPNTLRRELNRLVLETQQVPIGNATVRFRFQSLVQRWVILTAYWNRTMREIELGTYRRDLAKAHRHLSERGGVLTEADARRLGIPENRVKAFVGRQDWLRERRARSTGEAAAAEPEAAFPAASPPSPSRASAALAARDDAAELPGVGPGEFEAFYARFVDAHRQLGAAAPKASMDALRARLRQELPKLLGDKGGRVSLDVAVENGKVRLKARPVR